MEYPVERYTNEVNRLYGVMNTQLANNEYLAGEYSIADMACVGWVKNPERRGQNIEEFPYLKRWLETMLARPAVERGLSLGVEKRRSGSPDEAARKILFGQRSRK
jgi:GST-like protein